MKQPDCPYPGLRPFRESEAKFFCGRSQHRIELLTKLEKARFLAVVGASGSGKSSLVMAGLLCDIADGMLLQVPAGTSRVIYFKPGLRPFASLASALGGEVGAEAPEVDHMLRRSAQGFANALDFFDPEGAETYVVVADQFEELFRFADLTKAKIGEDEFKKGRHGAPLLDGVHNEAQAFVDLLLEAANNSRRQVFVVLTMRSDFLHRCEAFDRLPGMISANQYLTPRLQRDQQADAIAVPLKYFDASIKPALVNLILNDLSPEQDQLPILQHLLFRIWQETHARGGLELTIDDYTAVGGVANALNQHGEIILRRVSTESSGRLGNDEVGRFFCCLAEYDPAGALVRRPQTVSQVAEESGLPADDVRLIADSFRASGDHWLMPMVDEMNSRLDDNAVLDLTHESLLRKWKCLAGAAERDPQGKKTQNRDQSEGWMKIERDRRDGLLRLRDRMVDAGWSSKGTPPSGGDFVKMALSPIRVPITYFQLSRQAKVLRSPAPPTPAWGLRYGWNTEAIRLFLRLVLLRLTVFWGIVFLAMATGLFYYLKSKAEKQQAAAALAVSKQENELANVKVGLSQEVATASRKQSENLVAELKEAKQTIEQVQDRLTSREKILEKAYVLTSPPAESFSELRKLLEAEGYTQSATTPSTEPVRILSRAVAIPAHEGAVEAVAFLEIEGALKLVSGARDNWIKFWNLDGSLDRKISDQGAISLKAKDSQLVITAGDVFCRVWSPPGFIAKWQADRDLEGVANGQIISDGRVLFATTAGRIGLWRPGEPKASFFPTDEALVINSLNYLPSQEWVLASGDNGLVALWGIKANPPRRIISRKYNSSVIAGSLDPTGSWVLVVPAAAKTIDLIHLGVLAENPVISSSDIYGLPHDNPVVMASFSPMGDLIATADERGRIYLWSLASVGAKGGKPPLVLSGHSKRITAMQWDPNGRCLASADESGTVLLWQEPKQRVVTGNARLPFVLPGHEAAVTALTISPKGWFIATGGADKIVRIAPYYPTFAGPYRANFGGLRDKKFTGGEDLALFNRNDVANRSDLFLSDNELAEKGLSQPEIAKLGPVRRLRVDQFYVAARWDYSLTSRSFLRANKAKVRNPRTGKEVLAQPVDWGPNASSGAVADLSSGLAKELGLNPGDAVEIVVDLLTLPSPSAQATAE